MQQYMLNCMTDLKTYQTCIFLIDHWSPYASVFTRYNQRHTKIHASGPPVSMTSSLNVYLVGLAVPIILQNA